MSMIKKGMKAGEPEVLSGEKEVNEFLVGTKFMLDEKLMKAVEPEVLSSEKEVNEFLVGTKFMSDGELWTITEEIHTDNTDMRQMSCTNGDLEIRTLRTLQDDLGYKDIILIKD